MILRCGVLLLAGFALAGCANDGPGNYVGVGQAYATTNAGFKERDPSKKTLASKMLTAMALERVTGRKPDPARFSELN